MSLMYMSCLGSLFEILVDVVEILVDVFDLFLRQWQLPGQTILGARFQVNLVPKNCIGR